MDGDRFDALIRSLAEPRSRRAMFKTMAAGLAGGMLEGSASSSASARSDVTLCHKPGTAAQQSLTVDASAVQAHLDHGDYLNASGCCGGGVAVCLDGAGNGACCPSPSRCLGDGSCCTPMTCADAGATCGMIDDGCEGTVDCGGCAAPESCGGGGIANVCGCTPTTCAALGATCGTTADGCGSELSCGSCDAASCLVCGDDLTCASTCSGNTVCCGGGICALANDASGCVDDGDCCSGVCVSGICQAAPGGNGSACDSAADCAGGIPCVNGICCATGLVCGGECCTDISDVCFDGNCCSPTTCADQRANCGAMSDTCGSELDCGTCTPPQTCGGGGTTNVCGGCTPTTCQELGYGCGEYEDNCGGTQDCGSCSDGAICFNHICMPLSLCYEDGELCNVDYLHTAPPTLPCCNGDCHDASLFEEGWGHCGACRTLGEECRSGYQCCNPGSVEWSAVFGFCGSDDRCCSLNGWTCRDTADCCFSDGYDPIEPNARDVCVDGRCCMPAGSHCLADNRCCSNSCCLEPAGCLDGVPYEICR